VDARARLLRAAVGFALVPSSEPELDASFISTAAAARLGALTKRRPCS
jgi:hypothetical protein